MTEYPFDWTSIPIEATGLNKLAELINHDMTLKGFEVSWEKMPEKLLLVVTEISEATEIVRAEESPTVDFAEEISDAIIRLLHIAHFLNEYSLNTELVLQDKMAANRFRERKHRKRF